MKDMFPEKVNTYECGIANLGSSDSNSRPNWICYYKNNKTKYYFDSYGNVIDKSFKIIVNYLGMDNIYSDVNQIQDYNYPPICGQLLCFCSK